jgi:hypothetical protein
MSRNKENPDAYRSNKIETPDSSVNIALSYGLDGNGLFYRKRQAQARTDTMP